MPALSLRPSSKGVTVLIIVVVLVLFGGVLAYVAAYGKLQTATEELRKKERTVEESRQIVHKLEKSRLDYFDACSQVRYLESSVSTRDYVPTMLKQVERLGKSVNLRVLGVRPQQESLMPATRTVSSGAKAAEGNVEGASQNAKGQEAAAQKPKPYDELNVDMEIEGSYMNALSFVYRLTRFPKIVAVNKMEMLPSKDAMTLTSPRLKVKITLTAFILKEEKKAPAAATSTDKSALKPAPQSSGQGGVGHEAG